MAAEQVAATRRQGTAASRTRRVRIAESAAVSGKAARPCRPPPRSRRREPADADSAPSGQPGEPWVSWMAGVPWGNAAGIGALRIGRRQFAEHAR
ncbi:hypothetical protein DF17_01620 [Streptomyces rimosus]|nr:hypothetical protein DF17_01620 [Streptomyces rimosus]